MRATLFAVALAVCSTTQAVAKETTKINRPENVELFASPGDAMVRVVLKESLPNAFGGSDIFGRKRDRGVVYMTFAGMRDGFAVFRRRSVDIISDETTMSRSGMGTINGTVSTYGNTAYVNGTTTRAPQANVTALPPDTVEILLDLTKARLITVESRMIEIVSADESGVKFIMRSGAKR